MNKNHKFDKHFNNLDEENQEKYIEEMHEMADKAAKKNNLIFGAVVIPIVIVCILVVKQMVSFSFNLVKDDSSNKNNGTEITNNVNKKNVSKKTEEIALNKKIAKYIQDKNNREKSFKEAVSINKGSEKGVSVIFISQLYRNNGYDIPKNTISTKGLLEELKKKNWTKETDYTKLQKGDICFTTVDSAGSPSHAYIFMGWVKEGKTDYAYVCDGQTSDYDDTLHKRNLSISTSKKDKIAFFMKAPNEK
ncbi:hypothetical protein ACQX0N_01620 [Clostridium tepidum]|jgi:hypothetical protein|uniref:2,3-dihydro-2,3-dihydroxybenzoate dehydrogenase n=1 Tax=Clostridium tepidum TaxID=1962263 RepID=A0A1S9IB93_9CLOT|nr:hypothetical protein [Clostridium tepidum]MDU6878220.1 hypothetical protein [Clostridium botulinum]OOO61484.1 hypothetical protein BS637_11945 [Clostridium tepidum]OOO67599.1 hypothetical protein BS638_05225 [Clostridium tepidum]